MRTSKQEIMTVVHISFISESYAPQLVTITKL